MIVKLDPGEESRFVTLQDDWITTDVRVGTFQHLLGLRPHLYRLLGDIINIIGPFETSGTTSSTIDITSKLNYLILHPDILVTATALSNASQCRRKPLLSGLVRASSDVTPALVWGSILHEVMQLSMSENRWQQDWIEEKIDEVIRLNLANIVRIDMTLQEASKEVKARAEGLIAFADKYLGVNPKVRVFDNVWYQFLIEYSLKVCYPIQDPDQMILSRCLP